MGNNICSNLRIGIPLIGVKQWLGGVTYVELLVKALSSLPDQERPKIYFIVTNPESLELHRNIFSLVDGHIFFGWNPPHAAAMLKQPVTLCRSYDELADYIDFYYPVNSDVLSDVCSGSWIPDFQHVHLPEFFPKEELTRRDGWFQKIASDAKIVVFSSRDSENDFRTLYPESSVVTRVLHFYALPVKEWYEIDPVIIQKNYNLPDNFFICCNQFWVHKNHMRLFEALAKVRQTGRDVHLVCTGSVAEWRVRDYFNNLTELINRLNLKDCVHILGTIPRKDQIQLIRRSMAVIQPSLFEGWSTVVEDSRALGKTIILSDLAVHYEQAPDHSLFFDRNNPDDLADKILRLLPTLRPGPDASREQQAQIKAHELVLNYAKEFCDIALEAQRLCGKIMLNDTGDSTGHTFRPDKADQGEPLLEDNQRPDLSPPSIAVATSIAPKNIDNQQAAVASWLKLGFKVISANTTEEINSLKDHFPDVTFFEASRNAVSITGKPYIFFDDVLKALDASQSEICGIVNSDIHLIASDGFQEFIYAEAKDSLIYGTRTEIESLDFLKGEAYEWGFDYFFFDKSVISLFPNSKFSIGAPWWDLWACFIPAIRNICVKKLKNTVAYHKIHPKNWSHEIWMIFFGEFISHLNDMDIKSSLSADFITQVKLHIMQGRFAELSQYIVSFIKQKAEQITFDDSQFHKVSKTSTASNKVYNVNVSRKAGDFCPRISIVTPSFNQAQFLEQCIDSILSQNYPNLEYVIMDGGSTDNSVAIIKKYKKYLTYWQSKQDNGQYDAINEGFKKTTGEIMTWINSDDILHPRSLETVADIFLNFTGVEWIMGRPNGIVENTKQFWIMDDLVLWSRENYLKGQYKHPYIQQEGTFWKRSLWERAGGTLDTNLNLAGDMELWARFFRYAQLYSVDALLGAFRTHSAQKTAISAEAYHHEAEQIIDREIAFYRQSADKTLLPAPPPISAEQLAALRGQAVTDGLSEIRGEERPGVKVSAIVSTYNSERFMRGCLEDLVNQTLYQQGGLEIIVVDSGSEQTERVVVREFQQKHHGIHYLRTERRETVYAAWNKGIKAASGRYITNANTDDRHRKDALEIMYTVLENNPDIGLVYADVIITETENETFENHTRTGQYQWPDFDRTALSIGCFIGPQPMWRKSLHAVCGYFNESFSASGDWEFWLRIAEGAKFLHVREYLGLYLRSEKSLEHQNAGKRIEEDRSIYKTYIPKYLPAYDGYFTGIIGTDPNPVHVYRYGQVLAAFGRFDEAISLYESYVQRNPAYQGFTFLLNDLKNAKVRHSADQAPPPPPLPEEVMAYVNQADKHIANDDFASAREAIQKALRHTSGHPQLAAMLSNMLDNLNK